MLLESEEKKMNNIIERDEDFLGYVKDIKQDIKNHMKELEQAEEFGIFLIPATETTTGKVKPFDA